MTTKGVNYVAVGLWTGYAVAFAYMLYKIVQAATYYIPKLYFPHGGM